jgi:hypothetical protein
MAGRRDQRSRRSRFDSGLAGDADSCRVSCQLELGQLMNHSEPNQIFLAQAKNVGALESSIKHVRRTIHTAMRRGDVAGERSHTLVFAILYCAWLEAFLSKLVHTPFGLSEDDIGQIKAERTSRGISSAWSKCIELGLRKVSQTSRSNYLPNIAQRLNSLVQRFVEEPSLLRNKVAHGQWIEPLNRDNTASNVELRAALAALDIVTVDRWQLAVRRLAAAVEMLIESPQRAFHRDYWTEMAQVEADIKATEGWTRESRIAELLRKPILHRSGAR